MRRQLTATCTAPQVAKQLTEHVVSLQGMDSLVCRGLYSVLVLGFFLSLNIVTKETEEKILA